MRRSAKFAVLGVLGAVLLLSGCTTYVSVASDPEAPSSPVLTAAKPMAAHPLPSNMTATRLKRIWAKSRDLLRRGPPALKPLPKRRMSCVISNTVRRLSCSARPMRLAWKKIFGLPWSRLKSALNVPKRIAAACSFITKAAGCTAHFSARAFGISHSFFSNPLLQ